MCTRSRHFGDLRSEWGSDLGGLFFCHALVTERKCGSPSSLFKDGFSILMRMASLTPLSNWWSEWIVVHVLEASGSGRSPESCGRSKHWWFSGRILACHARGPGSIPGQCRLILLCCEAATRCSWPTTTNMCSCWCSQTGNGNERDVVEGFVCTRSHHFGDLSAEVTWEGCIFVTL